MRSLTELSQILWRQRRLLDLLTYRLEVQHLLLASGRSRWIETAASEVEHVLDQVRQQELARAVLCAEIGRELGLGPEPTLKELVAAATAPWDTILGEHQAALLEQAAGIDALTRNNRELLHRGQQATRDLLAALTGEDSRVYSATGAPERIAVAAHSIDWSV